MSKLIDITGKALSGEWGTDDETGNGIPVLRTTNFTNEGIVDYSNVVTRTITKKNIDEKYLKPGDIIIEKSGGSDKYPVGRVVFFDGPKDKYMFNNFTGLLRVRNRDKWYPRYVFYSLFGNYKKGGTKQFENKTTGLHNLKTDDYVARYEVPDMIYERQVLICNHLDKLLCIISKRKEQLQKLDYLIKARFVEMFDHSEFPMLMIEELCSDIVDCPHSTPTYEGELKNPAIRTSEIKTGYILWDSMRYVSDDEYEKRVKRLRPKSGDIVYGREGTFGNAAVLPDGYEFCLGQRVMLLRPDYSKCTSEYLLHAIISDDVYRQAMGKNNASTVAHVNVKDVKQFKVPLPPLEKQKIFASFIKQVDKSKVAIQKSLAETQLLFDKLMQDYFG